MVLQLSRKFLPKLVRNRRPSGYSIRHSLEVAMCRGVVDARFVAMV